MAEDVKVIINRVSNDIDAFRRKLLHLETKMLNDKVKPETLHKLKMYKYQWERCIFYAKEYRKQLISGHINEFEPWQQKLIERSNKKKEKEDA